MVLTTAEAEQIARQVTHMSGNTGIALDCNGNVITYGDIKVVMRGAVLRAIEKAQK